MDFGAIIKKSLHGFGQFGQTQTIATDQDDFYYDGVQYIIDEQTGGYVTAPAGTYDAVIDPSTGVPAAEDQNGNILQDFPLSAFNAPGATATPTPVTSATPASTAAAATATSAAAGGPSLLSTILNAVLGPSGVTQTALKASALTPYLNPTTGMYQSTPYVASTSILSGTTGLLLIGGAAVVVFMIMKKKKR